jgi:hypothetical protein
MKTAMSDMNKESVSDKSPFAGCAILIVALVVMLFLIGFSVSVLFRQSNEIARFTSDKPAAVAVSPLEDREAELNLLAGKLETVRLAVGDGKSSTLELTAGEMNLAIAAYEPFKDLRGTLRIASVSPKEIRLEISFPLNGRPRLAKEGEGGWVTSDPRFLNGTMVAKPGLLNKEVVLQIGDIEVPGKKVAEGFLGQMSPYRIAERYVGNEGIGTVMSELTAVELGEGSVRFVKTAGVKPKDTITNAQVDAASQRLFTFFAIAACLFLLFVTAVIIIALRLKKRSEAAVLEP